jgi:hypothetical protein
MKDGAKVLVITGNKHHLSPGNVPDWNALQRNHPYQVTWMPDIRSGSSDFSHESSHSGNHFGVHVHATELAALINVPLNNIVAVPDTATMMWVETNSKDQVTLKQDFLMQNPPVGSHCHGQFTGRTLQDVDSCGEARRAKCVYWNKNVEWSNVDDLIKYIPLCLPSGRSESQTLLKYITRSQKTVLDMIQTDCIQQFSDGITGMFASSQSKNVAMSKVGQLAAQLKGIFDANRNAWIAIPKERETWKYMTAVVMYRVNQYRRERSLPLLGIIHVEHATDLVLSDVPGATLDDLWAVTPISMRTEDLSAKRARTE